MNLKTKHGEILDTNLTCAELPQKLQEYTETEREAYLISIYDSRGVNSDENYLYSCFDREDIITNPIDIDLDDFSDFGFQVPYAEIVRTCCEEEVRTVLCFQADMQKLFAIIKETEAGGTQDYVYEYGYTDVEDEFFLECVEELKEQAESEEERAQYQYEEANGRSLVMDLLERLPADYDLVVLPRKDLL